MATKTQKKKPTPSKVKVGKKPRNVRKPKTATARLPKVASAKPKNTRAKTIKATPVHPKGKTVKTKEIHRKPLPTPKNIKHKVVKVRDPRLEAEIKSLKEETAALHEENRKEAERLGKLLEENANFRIKADAMLGQLLKGLYILGITPDYIQSKCSQMFRKAVSAD